MTTCLDTLYKARISQILKDFADCLPRRRKGAKGHKEDLNHGGFDKLSLTAVEWAPTLAYTINQSYELVSNDTTGLKESNLALQQIKHFSAIVTFRAVRWHGGARGAIAPALSRLRRDGYFLCFKAKKVTTVYCNETKRRYY